MDIADFRSITPILKGWSADKKFCAVHVDGTKYLLRTATLDRYNQKQMECRMMRQVAALGVPMCRPIELWTCGDTVYFLQSWIDGTDAEDLIPTLPSEAQYQYGYDAGKVLQQIHSVPAPGDFPEWEQRFNDKLDRKIQAYNDCPVKYENGEVFIRCINANRHLLKDRPLCYQHGDYHFGNMMVDSAGILQIIDFDRDDFGDPWEEFNRIVWCAQKSPPFASGMVDGYFDGDIPMAFWQLLALYISGNTLSSVPWAIPFGQDEVDTMVNQAGEVLNWYNNMQNLVPSWYK